MPSRPDKLALLPQALTLWRISAHRDLDGRGAFRAGGRWNSKGRFVVYLAETPAGAMLQTLVHLTPDNIDLPETFRLLRIVVSNQSSVSTLTAPSSPAWNSPLAATQKLGDAWLEQGETALARVPSVIMPHTWNYLLNPLHPGASAARVARISDHVYDPRLLRVRDASAQR